MQPQAHHEDRKHPRFKVDQQVFTVVKGDNETLGEVLDVSEGGLALKYVAGIGSPVSEGLLDMFATGGKVYLKDVPVRAASDFELPNEVDFSTIRLRRMGVAFKNLTDPQQQAIRDFIRENGAN